MGVCPNVDQFLNKNGDTMDGELNFDRGMAWSNNFTRCRISLCYDGKHWYGLGLKSSQLIHNVPTSAAPIFQLNNSTTASLNSSGFYVGSYLLSSTLFGYLGNITSEVQTQFNGKQPSESDLFTSGGTVTGDTNTSHSIYWTNQYGCKSQTYTLLRSMMALVDKHDKFPMHINCDLLKYL